VPTLSFREIQRRIREGRWEVVGGWPVEPDCNVPTTESFVRHSPYGKQYCQRALGVDIKIGFNPDSFGHSVGRDVNANMKWAELPGRIRKLKEPSLVLPTFSDSEVKRLVKWKPQEKHERRLPLLVLFLLDTGSRISQALGLRVHDINLDNLLVTLDGKGQKQRTVPFSFKLRKALDRH
jgi:integrase